MKDAMVLTQDKPKNEGYTQAEIQAEIRRRAYRHFEQGGKVEGYALSDWLLAEEEILGAKRRAAA